MFKVGEKSESVSADRDGSRDHIVKRRGSMSQLSKSAAGVIFCGIDVSAATLAVAVEQQDQPVAEREFPNNGSGHKALIAWLSQRGHARVSLEATGVYSLDLALALDAAEGVEVQVLNPKVAHRFGQTLSRSKTDPVDARTLAAYSRRMEFTGWRAPSRSQLQLRSLTRHIDNLTAELTRGKNRLHAAKVSDMTPACIVEDLHNALESLECRIHVLRREALALVRADAVLKENFELLISIPGIARVSALQILGELVVLSPELSVRQWVAHSGLDPAHHISGSSIHRPSRISRAGNRALRRVLYMPALVAIQHDPHIKAFYRALVHRHKAKMQALIAVARKLLHAIYGVLKSATPYDGQKLFPQIQAI